METISKLVEMFEPAKPSAPAPAPTPALIPAQLPPVSFSPSLFGDININNWPTLPHLTSDKLFEYLVRIGAGAWMITNPLWAFTVVRHVRSFWRA